MRICPAVQAEHGEIQAIIRAQNLGIALRCRTHRHTCCSRCNCSYKFPSSNHDCSLSISCECICRAVSTRGTSHILQENNFANLMYTSIVLARTLRTVTDRAAVTQPLPQKSY